MAPNIRCPKQKALQEVACEFESQALAQRMEAELLAALEGDGIQAVFSALAAA